MQDLLQAIFLASRVEPRRLTDILSWHQHLPFAYALTVLLRPRLIVELGTHRGDSYNIFCQAVLEFGLGASCFAVDTWLGDVHSGPYGEAVYEELRQFHDPLYGQFSTLLRMSFDQARELFSDASIDLLHIDGLHTEEAVAHDFETWLPKLSSRGVVLMHDISVRQGDFGVWKVWERLSQQYPSFAFTHGHGLGILLPGANPPTWLKEWCGADTATIAGIRDVFHSLGQRIKWRKDCALLQEERRRLEIERAQSMDAIRRLQAQRDEIEAIRATVSYRITAPLRAIRRVMPRFTRARGARPK